MDIKKVLVIGIRTWKEGGRMISRNVVENDDKQVQYIGTWSEYNKETQISLFLMT